jgi:hypothetical protein
MKPKRKRAPGAGRKPNDPSGPGTPFSVRIPEGMLNQLRAAAAQKPNGTVSGELLRLLQIALDEKAERRSRSRQLQGLFFLIELLDKQIARDFPNGWQSSPYAFGGLRGGILTLLEAVRPQGEVVVPPGTIPDDDFYSWPTDPEQYGKTIANYALGIARFVEREQVNHPLFDRGPDSLRQHYNKVRAVRDLGLNRRKK